MLDLGDWTNLITCNVTMKDGQLFTAFSGTRYCRPCYCSLQYDDTTCRVYATPAKQNAGIMHVRRDSPSRGESTLAHARGQGTSYAALEFIQTAHRPLPIRGEDSSARCQPILEQRLAALWKYKVMANMSRSSRRSAEGASGAISNVLCPSTRSRTCDSSQQKPTKGGRERELVKFKSQGKGSEPSGQCSKSKIRRSTSNRTLVGNFSPASV